MNDLYILTRGENCVSRKKTEELADAIKSYYSFSGPEFWMWKMFQFGFAYGKRAERARRKVHNISKNGTNSSGASDTMEA